jgi:hypothetical protein
MIYLDSSVALAQQAMYKGGDVRGPGGIRPEKTCCGPPRL